MGPDLALAPGQRAQEAELAALIDAMQRRARERATAAAPWSEGPRHG